MKPLASKALRRCLALIGLGILVCGPGVEAQERSKLEPPELSRYLRWGPLRARPGFRVTNFGWDDNIFASNANKVGDFTATLAPQLDGLVLLGSRAFLEFRESLEYTLYFDNDVQNFLNQRGSARVTLPFTRFGVFGDVALNQVRERPVDREDIRPKRNEDLLGFGAILELGWRTEIEASISGVQFDYSDPDFPDIGARLDRKETRQTISAGYRVRGRTRITLDAAFKEIDFDRAVERNSDEWNLLGGLEFGEGGPLTGTARVGWAKIDAKDPVLSDLSELIGDVELVYRLNSRTSVQLTGRRAPGFAIFQNQTYFLDTSYSLRGIRYLNRLIGVEAALRTGSLSFPADRLGTSEIARRDDVEGFDAGVRLRLAQNSLGRRIEYSLRIARDERRSNFDSVDRSQTRLAIDAVLGF